MIEEKLSIGVAAKDGIVWLECRHGQHRSLTNMTPEDAKNLSVALEAASQDAGKQIIVGAKVQ